MNLEKMKREVGRSVWFSVRDSGEWVAAGFEGCAMGSKLGVQGTLGWALRLLR